MAHARRQRDLPAPRACSGAATICPPTPGASRCRPRSSRSSTASSRRSIAIPCRCCCCARTISMLDASRAFMREVKHTSTTGRASPSSTACRSNAGRRGRHGRCGGCSPRWSHGRWRRNGTARRSTTCCDLGRPPGNGVRPDVTNAEQNFHTDNSYNHVPPHYVGLMCLRTAMEGGVSGIVSFATAHEEMRRAPSRPAAAALPAVLFRPAARARAGRRHDDLPSDVRAPRTAG